MAEDHSKAGGKGEEFKGKAKQAVGDLTDNKKMQAEGQRAEEKGRDEQALARREEERKEAREQENRRV